MFFVVYEAVCVLEFSVRIVHFAVYEAPCVCVCVCVLQWFSGITVCAQGLQALSRCPSYRLGDMADKKG